MSLVLRVWLAAVGAAGPGATAVSGADAGVTARQVVERIQQHVGVPWHAETVDTFKAGDPDTPVTGVAVTMMATLDVLQRAAAAGRNLIITHEPTFYGHLDQTAAFEAESDPTWKAKQAFIAAHGLVVWRFHDHWHLRSPDGIQAGVVRALGWQAFQHADDQARLTVPPTTLRDLAAAIRQRLGAATLRVVGRPEMKVTEIGLMPGFAGFDRNRQLLQRKDVEVLVIGEAREWETVEYAADAAAAGERKGLIVIGHIPSEQAGMDECARWLRGFITEVPVEFVPAADPFWSPRN